MSREERVANRAEWKRMRDELGLGLFDNIGGTNQPTLTLVKHYRGGNLIGPDGSFRRDAAKLANHGWSVASQSQSQRDGRAHIDVTYLRPNTFLRTPPVPSPVWYQHAPDGSTGTTCTIPCFACKSAVEVDAAETSYTCPSCRAQQLMRLCPQCSRVVFLDRSLAGQTVKCLSCVTRHQWTEWEKRPVSAGQYALLLAAAQPALEPAPTPAPSSIADELAKLAKLRDDGVLTDAEFASAKARLLGAA
jgi:hypothetical protein